MSQTIKIGFFGCGNVGSGVWKLLTGFAREITHRTGLQFEVKRVLVHDLQKKREIDFPAGTLTDSVDDLLNDDEISIILEFLGGEEPAHAWDMAALQHGKTLVTANKVAFDLHWHELQKAAKENGVGLYYEAAVCGAIPIIHTIEDSLQANRISYLYGIVNGTTNYILSRMSKEGLDYEAALREAQELGLAEPDPSSDVEGLDAAYKLSILASLAFHGRVPFEYVYVEGITQVKAEDIRCGQEMGYTLKLLAIAKRDGLRVETRVHPTFIRNDHPMANVSGSFNAVFLKGHACGEMMFMGRGAGDMPTASAIVSDLVRAASTQKHCYPTFSNELYPAARLESNTDWQSAFYVRMLAEDQPGVLSKVAQTFADHGVSIAAMQQKGEKLNGRVTVVLITHKAGEKDMQQAVREIDPGTAAVESLLRVEKE
ncbi:MAG: homoserine dehydrogenase [Eubacteriales bacterium]|nr:homoserine dehydrogenase [Eubacteriales bacterium]